MANQPYRSQYKEPVSLPSIPDDMSKLTGQQLNEIADKWAKELTRVKTNQIRNIFGQVNHLKTSFKLKNFELSKIERELLLLKPKIAYIKGRHGKNNPDDPFLILFNFFNSAINATIKALNNEKETEIALNNFFDLVESLVAYHKYHGGD